MLEDEDVKGAVELDYAPLDSFVAYMCVEGEVTIKTMGESVHLEQLGTVLIPAEATDLVISGSGKLLEIYIKE